ncbi:MAG: hypothetical protein EBU31_01670 [Proteobacteria bacterium]|nr:hypothetical protein [Pseudomonadota bacterium]
MSQGVPNLTTPLSFELITGGLSNLTYRIEDAAGGRWVLRRPPLGHVLATAHDMGREHRIISALQSTAVPVPPLVGFCDDTAINGAPFYVMELVPGTPYRHSHELQALGPERARANPSWRSWLPCWLRPAPSGSRSWWEAPPGQAPPPSQVPRPSPPHPPRPSQPPPPSHPRRPWQAHPPAQGAPSRVPRPWRRARPASAVAPRERAARGPPTCGRGAARRCAPRCRGGWLPARQAGRRTSGSGRARPVHRAPRTRLQAFSSWQVTPSTC